MNQKLKKFFMRSGAERLGPGLITGAADDDPSGIATYSQAGAQFGFSMLWTVVFTLPLMVAIQMVSARIGFVTGRGLAANIKTAFPRPVLLAVVGMLLMANTLNVAADIAAMAEALRLLVGGSAHIYAVTFGLLCLVLQVFLSYATYVRWLKWLTLTPDFPLAANSGQYFATGASKSRSPRSAISRAVKAVMVLVVE